MNVLLLTDFSSGARHAHKYALNFFANKKVNYFLLHANYENSKIKTSIDQQFEQEADKYKNWCINNSKITTLKSSKSLIDATRNILKTHNIDLVVMGANGNSHKFDHPLGSNTKSTATKIKCPVLIVFKKSIIKTPIKIAFPVDYIDRLKQSCIEKLINLPKSSNFSIEIFELNLKNLEPSAIKTARNELKESLNQLIINHKKESNFKIDDLETVDKKQFDLISFAAKNLSVYHIIFDQLNKANCSLMKQPPLYIVHS